VGDLRDAGVRCVVIGVWGANYYAETTAGIFTTNDRDLFLPHDSVNLLAAWRVLDSLGVTLWAGPELLDAQLDLDLAARVVESRGTVTAIDPSGLQVDLTLTMAGFVFQEVWASRRSFKVEGVEIPVARLEHIVRSKAAVGREKDRLFLAAHREELAKLLERDAQD